MHDAFGFAGGAGSKSKVDKGIGIRNHPSCPSIRIGIRHKMVTEKRDSGVMSAGRLQGIVYRSMLQTRQFGIALIRPRTIALLTDQYGGLKTIQYLHDLRNRTIPV